MSITFLGLAQKILEEEKRPLSSTEIWGIALSKGYQKLIDSKGKTPWSTLYSLIYNNIRDNPLSIFVQVSVEPKRYLLRNQIGSVDEKIPEPTETPKTIIKKHEFHEKDLHPLMVYYGFYYLKAYLKTIDHSKSGKKGYGEWVHPDIIGCYFPFRDWVPV
jgi:hypothetical protein